MRKNLNFKESELNNVKVSIPDLPITMTPEINIKFLNGEISIPPINGAYVVASGCGSGKTSAIKQIILSEYYKGVVYSASTIKECNEMYQFLINNGINCSDIIVLHSNYEDPGVNMNIFRNSPEKIRDYPIIICTHHKLLNEYPAVFQEYSRNKVSLSNNLSHFSRGLAPKATNNQIELPRQYILIDELPTCKSLSFKVNSGILQMVGVMDSEIIYPAPDDKDHNGPYAVPKLPLHYTNGGDYRVMEEAYHRSGLKLINENDTESGRLKSDLVISKIYENYDFYENMIGSSKSEINVTYTIADQVTPMMSEIFNTTRYIIFDGTGDLTFYSSDKYSNVFNVLTYDNKYNSPIGVHKMPIGYKRSYRTDKELRDKLTSIVSNIDLSIGRIKDIILNGHKILIVTWKNLKIKDDPVMLPISEYDVRGIEYTDHLKNKLNSLGFIEGVNYSIIHYQSGLDKATNEFREYDSIVFLGEFHVPNSVVNQFNQDYRVNTDILNYTLYQLVQAVCRTRIRNHKKLPIDIYFTDDWSNTVIDNLLLYLNNNSVNIDVRDTTLNRIKNKWKPVVKLFCSVNNEFKDAIEIEDKTCSINITLDDIWNLTREVLPVSEKKVKSYYPLINYLRNFGVNLIIESTGGRFMKKN